jgi:hypothetical protein|tara:strand:- start:412 stop:588 length:177 start_codon:yes stop_codon:yes gene_type:complete
MVITQQRLGLQLLEVVVQVMKAMLQLKLVRQEAQEVVVLEELLEDLVHQDKDMLAVLA